MGDAATDDLLEEIHTAVTKQDEEDDSTDTQQKEEDWLPGETTETESTEDKNPTSEEETTDTVVETEHTANSDDEENVTDELAKEQEQQEEHIESETEHTPNTDDEGNVTDELAKELTEDTKESQSQPGDNENNIAQTEDQNQLTETETSEDNVIGGSDEQPQKQTSFLQTGIPGFDDLIDSNGIPKGTSILLSGGPGSGKTTFSLQTLHSGALNGEKCIYLSFEESVERLIGHMENFGWNPKKLIDEGTLLIKRMDPFEISRSVEALLAKARGELLIELDEVEGLIPKDFHPSRIVLDSLSAVSAAFAGREEGYRIYIEQLFKALETIGATSFLITEINHDMNTFSRTGVEEFLSDGVIAFYNIRKGNIRVSATEIVKLRGVSHKKRIVPFNISGGKGIEVFPTEEIFVD